ncbi:MAG: hypothetical protein IJ054_00480, partial [Lachnospiraceae bacterium]|nr:hypothetical protein [Lachnospiraceae bacterium]
ASIPATTDDTLDKTVEGSEPIRYYRAQFTSTEPVVYCIRVMDVSGAEPSLAGTVYAVTKEYTDPVTAEVSYTGELAVLSDYFENAAGYKLYISAARISSTNSISEWSDEWYFDINGIGSKVE